MSSIAIAVPLPGPEWNFELDELVHAIAEDPRLHADAGHRIVARRDPPTIVVAGFTDPAVAGEVDLLRRQVESALPHARFVDFDQAVLWAGELAEKIRETVDDPAEMLVMGIPRGGLFVAGMLGYLLPLGRDQFVGPGAELDRPLLLVDDISLSGHRVGSFLPRRSDHPTVVATLCAPAPLSAALRAREPSVAAMIHAVTLADRTDELVDTDIDVYRTRWESDENYWVGRTDHIVFAWSEPESEATNPVTGKPSRGWNLAPSTRCLGNRGSQTLTPVLWDARPPDPSNLAPGWLIGRELDRTIAAPDTGPGQALHLSGTSHDMFWAAVETHDRGVALDRLAARYSVDSNELAGDYDRFTAELVDVGLLANPGT